MKYGYYYQNTVETKNREAVQKLEKAGCDSIVCEKDLNAKGEAQYIELNQLVEGCKAGDIVVIPDVSHLRKTVIQIDAFVKKLDRIDAQLQVIDHVVDIDDEMFLTLINYFSTMEKSLIRNRTSRGLKRARTEGRVGGRPRISQETIDRIQFLYNTDKYSLREIADQCNISLGTAYKYVQLKHPDLK